jgi:hypothetical protein
LQNPEGMKRILISLLMLTISVYLFSCEKEVSFDLGTSAEKVVVEGTIETDLPPYVFLTKSIGFFSKIDLNTLSNSFIHGAKITVSDGVKSFVLREYQVNNSGVNLSFYTVDSADLTALAFRGVTGKIYSLKIEYNGKSYESTTTIPVPKPLDTIWARKPNPGEMPDGYPDSRLLFASYTDPDTLGNRVRYFTKRNSEQFLPPYYSVNDDAIINGTKIDIQLNAGFNRMDTISRETFGFFYKGDTVIVKWSSIDKGVFDFWRTLEFSYGSTGNPFAAPVKVTSNISGGALGVWAGYGNTFDTLIISH